MILFVINWSETAEIIWRWYRDFDFKMTFIVHVLLPSVKEILHNDLGEIEYG